MTSKQLDDTIFLIGQMSGSAFRIDVHELEQFLVNPPEDFRFIAACRAALDFRKAIFPEPVPPKTK